MIRKAWIIAAVLAMAGLSGCALPIAPGSVLSCSTDIFHQSGFCNESRSMDAWDQRIGSLGAPAQ